MSWDSIQIAIVLLLTLAVFAAFVREWLSPDVVAMLAFSVLLATGILSTKEAFAVFSNSGPITVGCMFVLSAALERTGLIERIGGAAVKVVGTSPMTALVGMTLCVMALSAFMNNTPVVVILTPVAFMLARALKISPGLLLIPLSFASILGGTTTLIGTSTNLLVNGVLTAHGQPAISMFEITIPGLMLGLIGIAYMAVFGRWLLPKGRSAQVIDRPERRFVAELLVPQDSSLIGKTLIEAGLTAERGADVIDVVRAERSRRFARHRLKLQAGDRLVVRSKVADVRGMRESDELIFGSRDEHRIEPIRSLESVVMEAVIGPRSRMIGYRIADLNLRRLFGVYILAIHRQGETLEDNFDEIELAAGDTLLLEGPPDGMRRLFERRALVNLTEPSELPYRRTRAPIALGAILLVMVLSSFQVLPIEALALIASAGVIALGCLRAEEAYEAIEWRVLMLIFGMLALGLAMEKTGAAALVVHEITALVSGLGQMAVLSILYLITAVMTAVVSNNATAVLLTPIAIGLAQQFGADPRPFVMAVLFAASASFATPIGYQTNTFVYGVGGYRFADFLRIGVPLTIVHWLAASALIPWWWPFN